MPDDIARAVAENGGVIMVNYVGSFIYLPAYEWQLVYDSVRTAFIDAGLTPDAARDSARAWRRTNPMPRPDLGVVADHIEHLRDVAGADHVGIGSDLDGITRPYSPISGSRFSRFSSCA